MTLKKTFLRLTMPFLDWAYRNNVHLLRVICRYETGRRMLDMPMRIIGRYLIWTQNGLMQSTPAAAHAEFYRIQNSLGIFPDTSSQDGCNSLCYTSCKMGLKPGDRAVCDAVMTINDEMIRRLGGTMRVYERLTDIGGSQCKVVIE